MVQNKFCPIVKDLCQGEICMAWKDRDCSVFAFIRILSNSDGFITKNWLQDGILKDEEMVEQLLPECLDWAKDKKITRPTKEEIRSFLIVKGVTIGETAMRMLWREAKTKLRESKREMDYLTSQNWWENKSNLGLAWSSDENDALLKGFESGENILELSKIHKRSVRAIELRLEKFGKIQLSKQIIS